MKIVHICLGSYIEGAGYQENLLTKHHRLMGHDVSIVAMSNDYDHTPRAEEERYTNDLGIHVTLLRTKYLGWTHPHYLKTLYNLMFGTVDGLYECLCRECPDVLFVHGCLNPGCRAAARYVRNHPGVRLFADHHEDYYNTPVDTFKLRMIAKCVHKPSAWQLYNVCDTYWGVTPWRVEYLRDVYSLPEAKTRLLVMGGDDEKIDYGHRDDIRRRIRQQYGLDGKEILLVTGGKIDRTKNIHLLIEAIKPFPEVRLLVFGKPADDFAEAFASMVNGNCQVINIGWIKSDAVYDYFLAADMAVFPGTHSVLWEQAVACGVPCAVKHWHGMEHVNVNGNCAFINYGDTPDSAAIHRALAPVLTTPALLDRMKQAAALCREDFLYSNIAKKAIGLK